MDLRPHRPTPAQIARAADLACRGLLCYQPFIFSDRLQTGAGYEFAYAAESAGLVYCLDRPAKYAGNASVERLLIDPAKLEPFTASNQRLRVLYESFIEEIEQHLGPVAPHTFADIGCCSGYFPQALARRGAKLAVGFDRVDYSEAFSLLNEILGTDARFMHQAYRTDHLIAPEPEPLPGGRLRWLRALRREFGDLVSRGREAWDKARTPQKFDVVLSIAVLVHLSDPLHHLAYLGEMARKAILVWTSTSAREDELMIRYLSSNRYYLEDKFPYCFDMVKISPALLRKSLEMMGFTEIHQIHNRPDGMTDDWFGRHRGYLAIRP